MGIWQWITGRSEAKGVSFSKEFEDYFAMTKPKSGINVDWKTALDVTTVLSCVRVIAEGVAQVPLRVMVEDGKGSNPAYDHPLYKLLNRKPNRWQTSFAFRELMLVHLALTGNFFAFKSMVRGVPRELIPIQPGSVTVTQHADYSLTYTITGNDGSTRELPQSAIWHIRALSWDGVLGLDPVRHAREAIGLALAAETTQAEMHANGLQMAGTYATEQKIDPDKYKQLQAWIAAQVGGVNRHKPFIIDSGFKWTPQSMTGVDAQHLDTRKFQIEEICRAFRIFPAMIGHPGQSMTFASAEQVFLAHVMHSLTPWVVRIEQSIDCDLLNAPGDEKYFAKFNMNSLQRGAFKDRFEGYSKSLGSGGSPAWMTPNEIRALEDMNPIEGGDKLPVATNLAPNPDQKPQKADQKPQNTGV